MSPLRVKGISKKVQEHFWKKSKIILDHISFDVEPGSICGFLGVNGAGKTSTLKCILDFTTPDSGQILKKEGLKVGYMPERPYYYDFLTATEFMKFHFDLLGLKTSFESEKDRLLNKVELKNVAEKKLRFFSKGMLQRIGLAQALMGDPDLLILDEPMSGLDPHGRSLFRKIFLEQKQEGKSILFTTHLLTDVEEVCDRILIVDRGQMVFQGLVSDFKKESTVESAFLALRAQLEARDDA